MDRQTFERLCKLARLQLSDEEFTDFERKFSSMLKFVEQSQAYTPRVETPPLVLKNKVELRRDTIGSFSWPDTVVHDYRVPMIIDFEGGG